MTAVEQSVATPSGGVVGESPVAREFFAGRFAKVVAATFDASNAAFPERDVAFAVGALTFVGRASDAETCFEAWRLRGGDDARTLEASRFFLGVAHARSGEFDRARHLLASSALARVRSSDAWAAAFAFQGLAALRFFTGRYRAAARHALRASRAAQLASFPYVQMLSTDLRGHALVQLGRLEAGTALLQQAKAYAERLHLGANAFAIEASIAIYRAKHRVGPAALAGLEALLDRRSHDSYSHRGLLAQAAIQYALRGRGTDAARALAEVEREALRLDARRAKVTSLLARLHLTRWADGPRACVALLDEAKAWLADGDVAFRAELLAFETFVAAAIGDDARRARARADVLALSRTADHHLLRAALAEPGAAPGVFVEDEITPLLHPAPPDHAHVPRLVALGLLGPLPEHLGVPPGRSVALLGTENAILVQDRGDLRLRSNPPRWAPALLSLVADGATKETIVARLWGLRRYSPERHDPLVRTAIHRLRALLEPRGDWIALEADGYALAVPLRVLGGGVPEDAEPPDEAALEEAAPRVERSRALDEALLDRLRSTGEASVPELARAQGVSESTTLRALRRLVRTKQVRRSGAARATRYAPR